MTIDGLPIVVLEPGEYDRRIILDGWCTPAEAMERKRRRSTEVASASTSADFHRKESRCYTKNFDDT
jgi:hypothetical protein